MSVHPNVVLKCAIRAEGTTRALLRRLLAENREEVPDEALPPMLDDKSQPVTRLDGSPQRLVRAEDDLVIGVHVYHTLVMEDDYDESWQIESVAGDLVVFALVTYGYGASIAWVEMVGRVAALGQWCRVHHLEHDIAISANYW